MKRFKLLFALLAVITVAGGTLAFKAAKKVDIRTYYFTGASKAINTLSASSLVQAQVENVANYTTVLPAGYVLGNGAYFAGIVIDEDAIDLSVALSSVWSTYATNNTLPAHNVSFAAGTTNITVQRKTDTN